MPRAHLASLQAVFRAALAATSLSIGAACAGEDPSPGADCARLFIELVGHRPAPDEVETICAGRDRDAVIAELTATEAYRWTQRRAWADRLRYSEAAAGREALIDLDALVDAYLRGEVEYEDLVIRATTHPAFVGRFIAYGERETPAEAAFKAFLGRPTTEAEAQDLRELWRPWRPRYVENAPENSVGTTRPLRRVAPMIDPYVCDAELHACASKIFPNAVLAFPRNYRTTLLELDALTEQDWQALRVPGRLIASLPMLAESVPGKGPELDPATSKNMIPEAWLASAARLIGEDLGDCDFRAPSTPGWFAETARAMGGCPIEGDRRTDPGLDLALAEERAISELCWDQPAPGLFVVGGSLRETAENILYRAYGAPPSEAELEEIVENADSTDVEHFARELCTLVLGELKYGAY